MTHDNDEEVLVRRRVSDLQGVRIAKIERDPKGNDWIVYAYNGADPTQPKLMCVAIISAVGLFDQDGNYFIDAFE